MNGTTKDVLGRLEAKIARTPGYGPGTFDNADVLALVEIARAARAVYEAFLESGDCRTYPLVPLYETVRRIDDKDAE